MDFWATFGVMCYLYLLYCLWKRMRVRRKLRKEQRKERNAQKMREKEDKAFEKEKEKRMELLGLDGSADKSIDINRVLVKETDGEGFRLVFRPPFPVNAESRISIITTDGVSEYVLTLVIYGYGSCSTNLGVGAISSRRGGMVRPGETAISFIPGEDAAREQERKDREERERIAKREEQRKRSEIEKKLKERQKARELEKEVRQDLIDRGELFGDQTKRPPIPRDVVDAVYRRDGGRCAYCGSTEDLQLDHIIPFSKGGATSIENLQLLCRKCNLEKSNKIG